MREDDFVVMGFAYECVVGVSSNTQSFFSKGKHLFDFLQQEETGRNNWVKGCIWAEH